MRVRFLTSISSGVWGSYGPGEVGEVPDEEAARLASAGYVEPIETAGSKRETATRKGGRKAVQK